MIATAIFRLLLLVSLIVASAFGCSTGPFPSNVENQPAPAPVPAPAPAGEKSLPFTFGNVAASPDRTCGHSRFWNAGERFFDDEANNKEIPGAGIVGGSPAQLGEFPYQVRLSLSVKGGKSASAPCGASIISDSVLLTAAHCMKDIVLDSVPLENLTIYAGDFNRSQSESSEQFRKVTEYKIHEDYYAPNKDFDFCLLRLRRRLEWTKYVSPVCLPTSCDDICYQSNTNIYISGWGLTKDDSSAVQPDILQKAFVPLIDRSACKNMAGIKEDILQLPDSKFCAGLVQGGKDTCQGDSGGPAACVSKGYFTLIGVTSNGNGCALKEQPGLYANVCKVTKWIKNTLFEWGQSPAVA